MPALSPTMDTGLISKWNLSEGGAFSAGQAVCEVETDKATVSFDAQDDGFIAKILVQSGSKEIKVGEPIMVTVDNQEDVVKFVDFKVTENDSSVAVKTTEKEVESVATASSTPVVVVASSSSSSKQNIKLDRIFASPLARKLAREKGVSLADVSYVGKRVVAEDVLRAASAPKSLPPKKTTAPTPSPTSSSSLSSLDWQLDDLSLLLSNRQTVAKQVVPHYYLSAEIDLRKLLALRDQLNLQQGEGSLSVLDFFVKASALAMKQVPEVNSAYMDTFVRQYRQVDVNLVVSDDSGSSCPLISDCGSKGLAAISKEVGTCLSGDKSRDIGTFSIHNLGVYGVKSASPIVLMPQACALALGTISDTLVPAENSIGYEVAPVITATLSCDHRVVDGAVGAQWLSALKLLIENPVALVL